MPTYGEIVAQLEDLKKQAEKIRKEEFAGVVKAIKKQISDYGITAEDLELAPAVAGKRGRKTKGTTRLGREPVARRASTTGKVAPKYRDELGNTWTGRGKKPKWLVNALAAGVSLDSMVIR